MTNPTHAYDIPGKGRHYRHPITGEEWPSVTNVLGTAVAKPALAPWAAKATATAAWDALPRMVAYTLKGVCSAKKVADRCGQCRDCLTAEIKRAHIEVRDKAADLGSRVHDQAEAKVLGKPMPADDEAEPFVRALLKFWADFGVNPETDFELTEATVVNRRVGYAGTLDALLRLRWPDGEHLTLIDYKTSQTRGVNDVYPEHGMQAAALARAETVLLDNGEELPLPTPERIAILNLRADAYSLMPMPVFGTPDDAFGGFVGSLRAASYLHACYGAKPAPLPAPQPEKEVA